jgi:hypothetical protein
LNFTRVSSAAADDAKNPVRTAIIDMNKPFFTVAHLQFLFLLLKDQLPLILVEVVLITSIPHSGNLVNPYGVVLMPLQAGLSVVGGEEIAQE